MSDSSGAPALILRVSAPATEMSHAVITDLAAKLAAVLGSSEAEAQEAVGAVERVMREVAAGAARGDEIAVEFAQAPGALLIQARCGGRAADARHALPV